MRFIFISVDHLTYLIANQLPGQVYYVMNYLMSPITNEYPLIGWDIKKTYFGIYECHVIKIIVKDPAGLRLRYEIKI